MTGKVFVFDIDGTLSDLTHRLHYIRKSPKDWPSFKSELHLDTPHKDIIWLTQCFKSYGSVVICTARDETSRSDTLQWLVDNNVYLDDLFMRKANDYRDDGIVKKEMLADIREEWGEPFMWFDDRDRVVNAMREEGIRVLQVQPGNF